MTIFPQDRIIHAVLLPLIGLLVSGVLAATEFNSKPYEQIMQRHDVAAAAIIVVGADEVMINAHLGVSDRQTKQAFTSKHRYRIGSISKSFAGLLAQRLVAQGQINLADDVNSYGLSPYLQNRHPASKISLAHLLEHSAGLSDLSKAEWDYNEADPISLKAAFDLQLGQQHTRWQPGLGRSYSNVGAGLFGLALETKLGQSYESLMQQHVFAPLNMTDSSLLLTAEIKAKLIKGYDRDGHKPIKYWHNIYRPFAAINTSSADMIKWLQMWLQQRSGFLSAEQFKRLAAPKTTLAAVNGLDFGYGLGIYQWQTNGHSFWGHGGDADGYLTRFGFNPESGQAYFVMINAFNHRPLNQMVNLLEQSIINQLPKPTYPRRLDLPATALKAFTGSYRQVTARFGAIPSANQPGLVVSLDGQQLSYRTQGGRQTKLYAVTNNHFRTADHSTATMAFINHEGQMHFQGAAGNFVKIPIESTTD